MISPKRTDAIEFLVTNCNIYSIQVSFILLLTNRHKPIRLEVELCKLKEAK